MVIENQFLWLKCVDKNYFYDLSKKQWVSREEYTGSIYPATFPCRSYHAACRHIKEHAEIPTKTKFILVNKNVGFDRVLIKNI